MTHDELLEKIDEEVEYSIRGHERFFTALRAVVELHKPYEAHFGDVISQVQCRECEVKYPCATIQSIEKELKRLNWIESTVRLILEHYFGFNLIPVGIITDAEYLTKPMPIQTRLNLHYFTRH
jgi:hypothetical protein